MEPEFPFQWLAIVVTTSGVIHSGEVVALQLLDGRCQVRFLIQARPGGNHLLAIANPPLGVGRLEVSPLGSRIIGVVVGVQPDLRLAGLPLSPIELLEAIWSNSMGASKTNSRELALERLPSKMT